MLGSWLMNAAVVSQMDETDEDLSNNADSAAVLVLQADLAASNVVDDPTPVG